MPLIIAYAVLKFPHSISSLQKFKSKLHNTLIIFPPQKGALLIGQSFKLKFIASFFLGGSFYCFYTVDQFICALLDLVRDAKRFLAEFYPL